MNEVISVTNLSKSYGQLKAVDNISFSIKQGALFAFLGPNGAGKSTTINIICTLLGKTDGKVLVSGYEVGKENAKVRENIGVVFQDNVLDDLLTVKENLTSRAALYKNNKTDIKKRVIEVADIMDINEILNRRYGKLSGGQKRRTEIARALMTSPKILFLDEPTTGLDPQTRLNVWKTINALQKKLNMTVFLTTHYMEEAAEADDVAIIDNGKIVAQGTPNELKALYSTDTLKISANDADVMKKLLTDKGYQYSQVSDMLYIKVKNSIEAFTLLKECEGNFNAFEMLRGTMDDVFINITGHKIREE